TVLIDGKPSSLTGASRSAILEQIPANAIEKVEVITNPSAKYDPDGMSGIVNIILKKNKRQGLNGNVSVGIGTRDKYNAGVSLNYKQSKTNWFFNHTYRHESRYGWGNSVRKNLMLDSLYFLDQSSGNNRTSDNHGGRIGLDYSLTDNHLVGVSFNYNYMYSIRDESVSAIWQNRFQQQSGGYQRITDQINTSSNLEGVLSYKFLMKKPGQELSANLTYGSNRSPENWNFQQLDWNVANPSAQQNRSLNLGYTSVIQLDFVNPIKEIGKLEAGYKTILRGWDNDFVGENLALPENVWRYDSTRSNHFIYDEQVHAIYGTFAGQYKDWGIQAGLRIEQTFAKSQQLATNQVFYLNYFSLFPTLHLKRKLPNLHELSLSYSRRINRPSLENLNPFFDYSDPYNLFGGNPFIRPEYTHSLELGYAKYWTWGSVTGSVFYRHTENNITRYRTILPEGISITSFVNANYSHNWGFDVTKQANPLKWMNFMANFSLFQLQVN
ncbi:MAG: TonB-dependent receptor, partial [Bacteroidia bacterium]|nr:TonB-dependent receptor [Bacteroidia bacterium]